MGIPSLKLTNEGTKKIKHFEYERLLYVMNYLNPRQRLRNLRLKQKCFVHKFEYLRRIRVIQM